VLAAQSDIKNLMLHYAMIPQSSWKNASHLF